MTDLWPSFRAHRFLRNGHLQTLAGAWWVANRAAPVGTRKHTITLADGDQLILHEDVSSDWRPGQRVALLIHGLAGCHASAYMVRIARKLVQAGTRVFRLDLRGCGAGRNLATQLYHAGRWEDVQASAEYIRTQCEASPLAVVGFSLGGNLVLRWLAESVSSTTDVDRAIAVNPPVDLAASTELIARSARGLYDRHFARLLYRHVRGSSQWQADSPLAQSGREPRRLIEFDELYTAPLSGFADAAHYYESASSASVVPRIRVPTLILSAMDDPLIPHSTLTSLECPPHVQLRLERHGGHLGYIAAAGRDPDRHWMDWRVVEWLTQGSSSAGKWRS